jgi:flagellar biosynthetic protein FliR
MEILTSFAAFGAPAFALTLARVSGVFLMAPVFSSRLIPVRAKLLLALGITFAALPFATGGRPIPDNVAEVAVLAVKEVLVGAALAFSVSLVFAAIAFAGGLIDLTVGFAFANVVDPVQNAQISVMGQFYSLLASAVFVAIGGPDMVIAGLVRSFEVVPVTEMPSWPSLSGAIVNSIGGLFAVGLQVAAPVIVALLVTDAAVGFLARIAPQMNIFGIELPGKIAAMFLLLVLTAPILVTSIGNELQDGIAQMFRMILGGAG